VPTFQNVPADKEQIDREH